MPRQRSTGKQASARPTSVKSPTDIDREVGKRLLSKRQSEFVDAIAQIRNRYAHHLKNMALPVLAVADKIASEGGDKKLPVKLAGVISAEPLALSFGIRQFMYFQLANFLSDALHILRPPSPPSILGILSAMDTPDKAEFPGEVGDGPARAPRP